MKVGIAVHRDQNPSGDEQALRLEWSPGICRQRNLLLRSDSQLVEIDLLRGGVRLPRGAGLPPADYYAILSRTSRRPMGEVWPIQLSSRLPRIPIPLLDEEPDILVDLQEVVDAVYEQAGYDYNLNRSLPL